MKTVINSITDNYGNTIFASNNGKSVKLSLYLVAEKRRRRLGVINLKKRLLCVTRQREAHTLKNYNGYGFNYKIINEAKLFDKILIKDDYGTYLLPREEIANNGDVLNFVNKGGFELQVFYKIYKL